MKVVPILLFSDLESPARLTSAVLRTVWGLTDGECRIVIELCKGISLEETALTLGIAKETARKRPKTIFEKVGVHRQSELIAQVRLIPSI